MRAALRVIAIGGRGVLVSRYFGNRFFRANLSPANEVPPITTVTYSARATIAVLVLCNDAGAIVSGVDIALKP